MPSALEFDLGVRSPQHAGLAQALDPLVRGRRREVDLASDLLDGEPSIVLQQAQDGDVRPVKNGACARIPKIVRSIGFHADDNIENEP